MARSLGLPGLRGCAMSIPMEWRISKQRRRIGKLYWLQYGYYGVRQDWRSGMGSRPHWVTEYEEDYATLEKAKEALEARQKQTKPRNV